MTSSGKCWRLPEGELPRHDVVLRTQLAAEDRPVMGDRVQLQQVILNLIMNGVDAMKEVTERTRRATISSTLAEPGKVPSSRWRTPARGLDPQRRGTHVSALFHDETGRPRHGTRHLPINRRSPWRGIVGSAARAPWSRCPLHRSAMAESLALIAEGNEVGARRDVCWRGSCARGRQPAADKYNLKAIAVEIAASKRKNKRKQNCFLLLSFIYDFFESRLFKDLRPI